MLKSLECVPPSEQIRNQENKRKQLRQIMLRMLVFEQAFSIRYSH